MTWSRCIYILLVLTVACKCKEETYNKREDRSISEPNIILILGDDMGYEIPGYTGGQSHSTPNINQMASASMRFSKCNASPLCTPTRYMLLTGKYNNRNYREDSWGLLHSDNLTIANMMAASGYATCAVGKWQLDGGDAALKGFGFQQYCITNPFKNDIGEEELNTFYKSPSVYQDGAFLPASQTEGQFGEDVVREYMFQFIAANKSNKFFIYWAPNLSHAPFTPTPDDGAAFTNWVPTFGQVLDDTVYFPSMVTYFDKQVGLLRDLLINLGIADNTVILHVMGDNGTNAKLHNKFNNQIIAGGKGTTTTYGIHVPFFAYSPGNILSGEVDDMIDMVDFLPTIADLAGLSVPASFGSIDGLNFAPRLFGEKPTLRDGGFNYYDPNRTGPDSEPAIIWSFNQTYKLYDDGSFYNYQKDARERNKLTDEKMTNSEKETRDKLRRVIDKYK